MLSNWAMDAMSGEIREIAMAMTRSMNEIDLPSTWSGDDADRFQREWHDLVYSRLMAASNKLDGLSWKELGDLVG